MSRKLLLSAILMTVVLSISTGEERQADQPVVMDSVNASRSCQEIENALRQKFDLTFDDTPLREVVEEIGKTYSLATWIDQSNIEKEDATVVDRPIHFMTKNISIGSALNLMLSPLGLDWVIRDEVLMITTKAAADEMFFVRVYPVKDLITVRASSRDRLDFASLIQAIIATVGGEDSWSNYANYGGTARPIYSSNVLVIRQTQKCHREIEGLFAAIRRARRLPNVSSIASNSSDVQELAPSSSLETDDRVQREGSSWQIPRADRGQ